MTERCDKCGQHYDTVYRVPDDVWSLIAPRPDAIGDFPGYQLGGLLCMRCADAAARAQDIRLYFDATKDGWRRDQVEAENAELRDMLVAAYRELQRHGVKSVPLSSESVHRGALPTDWRCRCTLKRTVDKRDFMAGFICAGGDADEARKHADEYAVAVGAVHEAAPISQAAWASPDPKEYTPVSNAVLRFLQGTAPYNGLWFHEAERGASPYWWRKYLPKPEE